MPSVGESSSPRMDSSVDLPQPEGPAIEMYVPFLISRWISSSACVSTSSVKKTFFTPSILMSVPFASAIASPLDQYSCTRNSFTSPRASKSFASFVAQRDQGIDACGAPRRNVACGQSDQRDQRQAQRVSRGIARAYAEEQRFAQARKSVGQRQADRYAQQNHRAHFLHDQKTHVRGFGAERHADANLARPLHNKIRQHSVNAHSREQRRQSSEGGRESGDHTLAEQIFVDHALHGLDPEYRKIGVELLHRTSQSGDG